jgi:hypothetical protein
LKYLYFNAGARLEFNYLYERLKLKNKNIAYFRTCLEWLVDDKLIEMEGFEAIKDSPGYEILNVTTFRISHLGYKFITELKSTQNNFWLSILAIIISALSVIYVIFKDTRTETDFCDLESRINQIEQQQEVNANMNNPEAIIDSLLLRLSDSTVNKSSNKSFHKDSIGE